MIETFKVKGMHCASCASAVERILKKQEGVQDASVNLLSEQVSITSDAYLQDIRVMQQVQKRLENGRACLIFPEGTRSRGNRLGEFKPGCFKPAVKAHCPIVPAALVDSFLPFDSGMKGPVTVYLHVLEPLGWEDYQDMTTAQIAETVKVRIREEMAAILARRETDGQSAPTAGPKA